MELVSVPEGPLLGRVSTPRLSSRVFALCLALLPARGAELTLPGEPIDTLVGVAGWGPMLAKLAAQGPVVSSFTEQRWFPIRKKPVVLDGELRFSQEFGLSLRYLKPEEKMMILDEQGLLLRDGRGRQKAATQDSAGSELGRTLMALFAFDPEQLRTNFEICGNRDGEDWRIDLKPRSEKQRTQLGTITVFGLGTEIRRLELRKAANQRVEVRILETRHVTGFSEAERKRFFR